MEIKLEPEDCYNFSQTSKIASMPSAHYSNIRIKTEVSNPDVTTNAFNASENQPAVVYIKQENCKQDYEDENKIIPKCENVVKRKQFACSLCVYTTDRRRDLFVHRETHKIINYLKCSKCGTNTKHQIDMHNGKIPFKCVSCKNKAAKEKLKSKEKYFYCNSCGFKAAGLSRFQMMHELVCHKVEKPFTCSSCDYKCVTQSALTDHSVTHIGGNPFPCSICYYRTNSQESLEVHMISHKPLFCTQCDYRCATQSTLNKHLKTHSPPEGQSECAERKIYTEYDSAGLKSLQTVKMEDVCINKGF